MGGRDPPGEAGGIALPGLLPHPARTAPHLAVLPQLVALHAVAVVEGDRASVGDSVEAELLGVLRVPRPDVLPPGEGEDLQTQGHLSKQQTLRNAFQFAGLFSEMESIVWWLHCVIRTGIVLSSRSSCLQLPSAEIIGSFYHAWLANHQYSVPTESAQLVWLDCLQPPLQDNKPIPLQDSCAP